MKIKLLTILLLIVAMVGAMIYATKKQEIHKESVEFEQVEETTGSEESTKPNSVTEESEDDVKVNLDLNNIENDLNSFDNLEDLKGL